MGVILRKNYFAKLFKYIKNVYEIEEKINRLTDGRINPSYNTGQVMLPVLFGFLLKIQSLNELNCMLKENEFKKLFSKKEKATFSRHNKTCFKHNRAKWISKYE